MREVYLLLLSEYTVWESHVTDVTGDPVQPISSGSRCIRLTQSVG